MIKEVKLTKKVFENSWRYWYGNDYYHIRYDDWVKGEYKLTVITSATSLSDYYRALLGEEKDLTLFLLRWS
jgi:hypothetical protein